MKYPSVLELEEFKDLIESVQLKKFVDEDGLHELWDTIKEHVDLSQYKNLLSNICKDFYMLLSAHQERALLIIFVYASNYPKSYETTATNLGISRTSVYKSLTKSAKEIPWLQELMNLQSESFRKNSAVNQGKKHSDETRSKISDANKADFLKRKEILDGKKPTLDKRRK